jgi:hypothetical protein
MRPQYLKDIISLSAGEAGQKALRALTKLCKFFIIWATSFRNLPFICMARLYVPLTKKMEELDRSLSETVCED